MKESAAQRPGGREFQAEGTADAEASRTPALAVCEETNKEKRPGACDQGDEEV